MTLKNDALNYHRDGRKGKIEIKPTKSMLTSRDLSLAYSPGVAIPCLEIAKDPALVFDYTSKGNLVAVVTNGTAVLGIGNIGPLASKPVMEGKAVLFKKFADIDVFDIELKVSSADEFIQVVKAMEPTFGGINIEDVAAPDCFYIEEELKKCMNIPVFHDDQHGTAIISAAALINALQVVKKKIEMVRVVFNGAGAAGIACCKLFVALGVKKENLILCDSRGVVYKDRAKGMNPYKEQFASLTDCRTLAEAMRGADVFVGVSVKNIVTKDMVVSMAENPIVFALANPDPEISYEDAKSARPDAIIATGRTDYPNQVNNVLGFPFIFRGALDCQATQINEEMKLAAALALADLAREDVPDSVLKAYGEEDIRFGPEYLIPKPFDPRIMLWVTPAVARAAVESGVARIEMKDFEKYKQDIEARLGKARQVIRIIINKAKRNPKRIVFPEAEHPKVLRAAQIIKDEGFGDPILIGNIMNIERTILKHNLNINIGNMTLIERKSSDLLEPCIDFLFGKRQRSGITRERARQLMLKDPNYFAAAMLQLNKADAMISGLTSNYSHVLRPAIELVDKNPDIARIASMHMIIKDQRVYFFADTVVNINPDADTLVDIALQAARFVRNLDIEPRMAVLSYSNFGSTRNAHTRMLEKAVQKIKDKDPSLIIDGEMMLDYALNPEMREELYPFSSLKGMANVFIFPELNSANIAFRMMNRLGGAERIGPILMGFDKSIHLLARESDVQEIVNMAAIAVVDAQEKAVGKKSILIL